MIRGLGVVVLVACGGAESPGVDGYFVEGASLEYRQSELEAESGCVTSNTICEPEYFSGGLAIGDLDGNGWLDVVATRLGQPDLVFLNEQGDLIQADWGLNVAAHSNGAALFDADVDGDLDLYVTVLGAPGASAPNDRYAFYDNVGGRFELVQSNVDFASTAGHAGTSVAVGDFDADGLPDLHLNEWKAPTEANGLGHPFERLLHNSGTGSFEDVTINAGVFLASDVCLESEIACIAHSFASTFVDLDDDGIGDLAIAGDFGRSRLFWGRGDGTFEDGTEAAGVATDENGMGSTFGDFDGDGDLDWFVSSIYDDPHRCEGEECYWGASGNRLFRNEGDRRFVDVTDELGVRDGGWGWGAAFLDFDNDADLDLVMTNGFDLPTSGLDDSFAQEQLRLWRNDGDRRMREIAVEAGLVHRDQGRGLCVFDVDNDGDEDVLVVSHGGGARLFRNEKGSRQSWLQVRVLNRRGAVAYGARVEVIGSRRQVRQVGVSHHYLCSPTSRLHFGLGGDEVVDIQVRWPSGEQTIEGGVRARQLIELRQN